MTVCPCLKGVFTEVYNDCLSRFKGSVCSALKGVFAQVSMECCWGVNDELLGLKRCLFKFKGNELLGFIESVGSVYNGMFAQV